MLTMKGTGNGYLKNTDLTRSIAVINISVYSYKEILI